MIYIKRKPKWINFIATVEELDSFADTLVNNTGVICIGDLANFSKPMRLRLLKLIEENSNIDLYSSEDLKDPVLLSRIPVVAKDYVRPQINPSEEEFEHSPKKFVDIYTNIVLNNNLKLRCLGISQREYRLLNSVSSK